MLLKAETDKITSHRSSQPVPNAHLKGGMDNMSSVKTDDLILQMKNSKKHERNSHIFSLIKTNKVKVFV